MTLHYHGTPLTPIAKLLELRGRHFCVSHADPRDVARCHELGQSVMLDNGAFSQWRRGAPTNWPGYYAWADRWLDYPTTWAVIPDVIGGTDEQNDALISEWPHGDRGAPVWHLHSPIDRLLRLTSAWPLVCVGSSGQFATVGSPEWERRMDEAFNALSRKNTRTPRTHMLRGLSCSGKRWPFYSVDSTNIARNHNRPGNTPLAMADKWDGIQCAAGWVWRDQQEETFA